MDKFLVRAMLITFFLFCEVINPTRNASDELKVLAVLISAWIFEPVCIAAFEEVKQFYKNKQNKQ